MGSSSTGLGSSFSPQQLGTMFGIGGVGSGLAGLFGGNNNNPANAAMPYLQGIPDAMKQFLAPYLQGGGNAFSNLQGQYGNILNDPGAALNKIGSSYQQSPGYQFALQQSLGAANRASAAGGMAGSPLAQQQNQQVATGLANQDYYNYLDKATGLYGQGLQGEQGLANMGFGASNNMADSIAQMLAQQGAYGYAGQAAQNQAQGSAFGNLFGGLGALAAFFK